MEAVMMMVAPFLVSALVACNGTSSGDSDNDGLSSSLARGTWSGECNYAEGLGYDDYDDYVDIIVQMTLTGPPDDIEGFGVLSQVYSPYYDEYTTKDFEPETYVIGFTVKGTSDSSSVELNVNLRGYETWLGRGTVRGTRLDIALGPNYGYDGPYDTDYYTDYPPYYTYSDTGTVEIPSDTDEDTDSPPPPRPDAEFTPALACTLIRS